MTSEKLIKTDHTGNSQILAILYDFSEQEVLRQFSLTRYPKIANTREFRPVSVRAKSKRNKTFRCSATFPETRVF